MYSHRLGLRGPDRIDRRDFILTFSRQLVLPEKVSLRDRCPDVFNQLNLGSCVANATCGVMQFNDKQDDNIYSPLSRRMLHRECLEYDGNPNEDLGTYVRTAIRCAAVKGVCLEKLWPYNVSEFDYKPNADCYADALNRRIYAYHRILSMFDIRACLTSGKPFILGIPIFTSFESDHVARTGEVPMPKKGELLLGYHAVYCCGYNDKTRRVECANSWGYNWGDRGFFTLPYAFIEKYVLPEGRGDCWTITRQLIS